MLIMLKVFQELFAKEVVDNTIKKTHDSGKYRD
jgi:hypothetical protein